MPLQNGIETNCKSFTHICKFSIGCAGFLFFFFVQAESTCHLSNAEYCVYVVCVQLGNRERYMHSVKMIEKKQRQQHQNCSKKMRASNKSSKIASN